MHIGFQFLARAGGAEMLQLSTTEEPATCTDYMSSTGCGWTSDWNCPGQPDGKQGPAGDDGSIGYECCCNNGLWQGVSVFGFGALSSSSMMVFIMNKKQSPSAVRIGFE